MSEKKYIRNGQSHFAIDRSRVTLATAKDSVAGKKNRRYRTSLLTELVVVYTILLLIVCAGFVTFSYLLYERQNSEELRFTDKINQLNEQIDSLRKKFDTYSSNKSNINPFNMQNMLQASVEKKFSSIAIDSIVEYPDMEANEVENDEYQDDAVMDDDLKDDPKDEPKGEFKMEKSAENEEEPYGNYRPFDPTLARAPSFNKSDSLSETRGRQSKLRKRNAPPLSRNQLISSKNRYSNNNNGAVEQTTSDTLADSSSDNNKKPTSKGQRQSADKKCTITIPLEDFINHFKHYKHEDNAQIQSILNKTGESCGTIPLNTMKHSTNKQSGSTFRLRSSEEEDTGHASGESIMGNRRKPLELSPVKLQDGVWKKQVDVEIFSENGNEEEAIYAQPKRLGPVAVHVEGQAINHDVGKQCYAGNGRICHPTGEPKDWIVSNWFQEFKMHEHFTLNAGKLKVHKSGLYFVYAQILFSDKNDYNGYYVLRNNEVVLQCTSNVPTSSNLLYNSCYTGGIIRCFENDTLALKIDGNNRYVTLVENMSYFGMFRVGENEK